MDYQKIYNALIERARYRDIIGYSEKHHINPDFMYIHRKRNGPLGHLSGNPDDSSNIVRLYPREHFVAHLLLAEIYKNTRYGYPAQSSLMFFAKVVSKHPRQQNYKMTSREYALARDIGISAISKARKGKMPCVDAYTGESVGSQPVDHPNVLSGKWVHHSKGFTTMREKSTGKTFKVSLKDCNKYDKALFEKASGHNQSGCNNGNYKELTEELKQYIFDCIEQVLCNGHLIQARLLREINKNISSFSLKSISCAFLQNKFGTMRDLVTLYNQERNASIKFNPYYRGCYNA